MKLLRFLEIKPIQGETGQQFIIIPRYVITESICSFVRVGIPSRSGLTDAHNNPVMAEGTCLYTSGGQILVENTIQEVETMLTGEPAKVTLEDIETEDTKETKTIKLPGV